MAQDSKQAEAADDGDFLPDMPVHSEEEAQESNAPEADEQNETLAIGLAQLETQALDSSEVARQIEDLTTVVLSSAEVSTRSAEVGANISHEMRGVMKTVTDLTAKNILHSRVILIGLLSFFDHCRRYVFRHLYPFATKHPSARQLVAGRGQARGGTRCHLGHFRGRYTRLGGHHRKTRQHGRAPNQAG